MNSLLDLFVKIGADTSGAEKGFEETEKKSNSFASKLKTAMKVGATAIAAVTAATAAMAGALTKATGEVASYGDNIDKMSQKMGLSATAYQEWDAIMQHSGTSIESLRAGMKTLANAVENGNKAFERLGISQEEIASMNNEQLFSATITALQNVENETERTYLAGQLLGRGATELGALLNTSAEDTEAMRQRVHELGGIMSDEAVKASAAYQDSLQDMQTAFAGIKRGLIGDLLPGVTTVMDGLTQIFSGEGDKGIAVVSDGVDKVLNSITDKLPEFLDLGAGILEALVNALIDNLPKILESGGKIIGELVAGLLRALPVLIKMVPDIVVAIVKGLASAWPDIRKAGSDLIKELWNAIKTGVDAARTWGRDLINNFVQGIKDKINNVVNTVKGVAQTVKNFLGFSEPKDGPLSNFHTYAPDMMKLFAEGIKNNEKIVTNQIKRSFDFDIPSITSTGTRGISNLYGTTTINVYPSPGMDEKALADMVMMRMQTEYGRKVAALT